MKEIIDKLDFLKIKNFCSVKDAVKRMRRQATYWEKNLQKTYLIKECYPKYTPELSISTIRKQTSQLKIGKNTQIDTSPKKIYRWQISL